MVDSDQALRRKPRSTSEPAPSRWARIGALLAQVSAALIILVGMQYLLRQLAELVLTRGP